jgi:hypothetical protein
MTMFSMKPKFDLAAFLAEPATPNASRRRNAMKPSRPPEPADEATDDEKTPVVTTKHFA